MQNKYAGDIGDYGKLGLLRFLHAAGLTIGPGDNCSTNLCIAFYNRLLPKIVGKSPPLKTIASYTLFSIQSR